MKGRLAGNRDVPRYLQGFTLIEDAIVGGLLAG